MKFHMHKYKFDSEISRGHKHRLLGYAGGMIGIGNFHFHYFYGISSYNNHTHYFSGITGMPVKTENGHIHKMEGLFECNSAHRHSFEGSTFEEISYISGKTAKEAYII